MQTKVKYSFRLYVQLLFSTVYYLYKQIWETLSPWRGCIMISSKYIADERGLLVFIRKFHVGTYRAIIGKWVGMGKVDPDKNILCLILARTS